MKPDDPCPPANVIERILLKFGPLLAWNAERVIQENGFVLRGYALYGEPWNSAQRESALNASSHPHDGYKVFKQISCFCFFFKALMNLSRFIFMLDSTEGKRGDFSPDQIPSPTGQV